MLRRLTSTMASVAPELLSISKAYMMLLSLILQAICNRSVGQLYISMGELLARTSQLKVPSQRSTFVVFTLNATIIAHKIIQEHQPVPPVDFLELMFTIRRDRRRVDGLITFRCVIKQFAFLSMRYNQSCGGELRRKLCNKHSNLTW